MIKFFRKIRQNLIIENKTSKYFKYAIGEIVLVMIGILLALQVSNWNNNNNNNNNNRLKTIQEIDALKSLKYELFTNIKDFRKLDSIYKNREEKTLKAISFFDKEIKVKDIVILDSLIDTRYATFPQTRSTYNEMINTGNFYNLKNIELKTQITNLYNIANNFNQAFIEINKEAINITNNPSLDIYNLLKNRLKKSPVNIKGIDTSWIKNPNSDTYLALFKKVNYLLKTSNEGRRIIINKQIYECDKLINAINKELHNRNQ